MSRTAPRSVLALSAVAAAALLSLTACGGSGGSQTAAAAGGGTSQQTGAPGRTGGFAGGGFPGASGRIAAIAGKTLQVQGSSAQVAVTYTAKTAFTDEVSVSKADVKVGSCVMVTPDRSSTASSSSDTGAVAAGSVRITAATDGSCSQGFGGGFRGGDRPSGAPSGGAGFARPSGMPSGVPGGVPSGGPGGDRGGFGFGAFGQVTAVSGTGFTVASTMPSFGSSSSAGTTTDVTVTVGPSTTYTTTKSVTSSALKVGLCASATGQTDDTGAVSAERISLSRPVDGECTGGFGGFGGFRGGSSDGAQ